MLQNSKSIYFLKRLFTFIDEKNKLDIIKYNKNMQNILDISLIDYKTFSERYILYGENGKGKEYDIYNDKILFEGEYLNRKRNGKGKEFCGDKIEFEGEFLNGRRNGKGKEYYDNGELKFEGEFLFNKKWNGKGYDKNHNIIYELNNGNGKVKEYDDDGKLEFEGEYLNGKRNGKGKEYYKNGKLKFEGEYLNNKMVIKDN